MSESPQIARVRQARASLLLTHPFFGVLALKVDIRETNAIPTAGVTDTALIFNPGFVDTLSSGELKGLIAHEVMHLALGHHAREGCRNHTLWNLSCDHALNPVLIDDGFILPAGACINPAFKGLTAEAIYEKLREQCKQAGIDPEAQGWGEFTSAGPAGSAEANEAARQWMENAAEAMRAAKSAGKLPANISREITEALRPRADWRAILRRFMTDQVKRETTWSTPNKRFYPGIYVPGTRRAETMGPIVIGVDTSGSISGDVLNRFAAEVSAIVADVEPSAVHVVYCDAQVNGVESFEPGDDVKLRPHGGGGTDFRPVFDWATSKTDGVAAIIYLTDGCGTFPDSAPDTPVLWASTTPPGGVSYPWGEIVYLK